VQKYLEGNKVVTVAVIIPCYNAEKWVARAIQSVLDQGYPNLEAIVIDDGSTDNSLDVIRSFGDRIRWETSPNRGAPAARNRGLALTQAAYVMFLDADDYIEPGSIANWVGTAHSADLILGCFASEHAGVREASRQPHSVADSYSILRNWLNGQFTPPCSVLWRRSFLLNIGGWNESVKRNQDGELVVRALIEGARAIPTNLGLGVYVQHDGKDRVSRRTGREILLNQQALYSDLLDRANCRGLIGANEAFAFAYYRLACEAFASRIDDLGKLALKSARELGLHQHLGSPIQRLISNLLGLQISMRIMNLIQAYRVMIGRTH